MAIDIDREELLSLAQATHRIPGRPTIRSLWRWVNHGVGGQRLETIKCGSRRFTSMEAIRRFIDRQTNPHDHRPTDSARRAREIREAEAELQQAGF